MSPIRPVAPYLDGKRNLARRICAMIDADGHTAYAEPFVGMGGIFLRRTRRPRAEFINDRGRDVYNLFRVLQEHYVAFLDLMRLQITTQAGFERLVQTDPDTLTDLQRAARFLYLQRRAFGGKPSGRNFGISTDRRGRFNLTTLEPDLEALHERLAGVTVTCMDWAAFITRVDRPGTLFYLDPPYWGCEGDYGKGLFERTEFERMADILRGIKGRFILSLNDLREVRQTFAWFRMEAVDVSYTIAAKASARGARGELLVQGPGCCHKTSLLQL
nr:DNA adenine methylase [Rhodovulum sp.]